MTDSIRHTIRLCACDGANQPASSEGTRDELRHIVGFSAADEIEKLAACQTDAMNVPKVPPEA